MGEAPVHPVKEREIRRGAPYIFQAEQGILSGRPKGLICLKR